MIIPLKDYDNIIELISDNSEAPATYNGITRELSTPYHYGYLKIADGCNNKCAYCAIPSIRGKYISEPKENVINEAKEIIGNYGIDELILVAQDVTRYGHDIYGEYALLNLLDDLEKLDLRWIRLMYCYPELITDDLIRRVSSSKKIASYLDIPMQHINDNILKTMNRRNNKEYAYNLIDRIKNIDDNISIRSTFICGLPNEGEAEHKELIKFLEYAKFDNCGFFAFSREKGTQAYNMPNQVKNEITLKRVEELYSIQSEIVQKKHSSMIGDNIELVYEGIDYEKQSLYGRTYRSAPDIDTIVLFTPKESPEIADFVKARITGIDNLDLVAELI